MKKSPPRPPRPPAPHRGPSLPPAPKGLSAASKKWWEKIVGEWNLDDPSLLILANTLQALDRMEEARKLLANGGLVTEDRFGQQKMHPAFLIERDSRAAVLRGLKSLGLDLEPLHPTPGRPPGGGGEKKGR